MQNQLNPITIAYVGIGVVAGLNGLPEAQYRAVMDHHEGQLCIVQAAIDAARDHDIGNHECDGCHAYEVAEQFGIDFVETEVARLAGTNEEASHG